MKIIIVLIVVLILIVLATLQYKEKFFPLSPSYLLAYIKGVSVPKEKKSRYYYYGFENVVGAITVIIYITIGLNVKINGQNLPNFYAKRSLFATLANITSLFSLYLINAMILKLFYKGRFSRKDRSKYNKT